MKHIFNLVGKKISEHLYATSLISSLLFLALFFKFMTPIYETNDDTLMMQIANGYYTGSPNKYLFLSHIWIGEVLSKLYTFWPSINWYTTYMCFIGFLCLYTSILIFLKKLIQKKIKILFAIFLFVFYVRFFLFLQWTVFAALAATNGFFLFFVLVKDKNMRYKFIHYCLSYFLIIISDMIREKSFVLITLLVLPLLIQTVYQIIKEKKNYAPLVFILVVFISIVGEKKVQHLYYYENSSWKNFSYMFDWREALHALEVEHFDDNREIYKKIGWSNNDYKMFRAWLFHDENTFTTEKIKYAALHIRLKGLKLSQLKDYTIPLWESSMRHSFYILYLITTLLLLWRYTKKKELQIETITFAIASIVILYFSYMRIVPPRFLLPIVFYIGFLHFFLVSPQFDRIHSRYGFIYNYLIISCASIFIITLLFNLLILQNLVNNAKIHAYKTLESHLPKKIFILGSQLKIEWVSPFENKKPPEVPYIFLGGWTLRTPNYYMMLKKYGISNIYKDLYTTNRVTFIGTPYDANILKIFIQEHYHQKVRFDIEQDYHQYGFDLNRYKVVSI